MPSLKLNPEIIYAAIDGFEAQKLRIDAQIADLRAMLPGGRTEAAVTLEPPKRKHKRKLSAAGRANIVAALKNRWATKRATAAKAAPGVPKKTAVKKVAKAPKAGALRKQRP